MDTARFSEKDHVMTTNTLKMRVEAFDIIREKSFSRENVTLSSGRDSSFYFDMKPSMLDPACANLLSRLVLKKLEGVKVDCIGGLEMGAVPLIGPVVMTSEIISRPIPGFFIRKNLKGHGTMQRIEGFDDLKGKNVVILDDVTTSGQSAMAAVNFAQEAGGRVVLVLSIVDREEGATEFYKNAGIPFQCLFRASEFLAN